MDREGKKKAVQETTSPSEEEFATIRALKRARNQESQVSLLIDSRDGVQIKRISHQKE